MAGTRLCVLGSSRNTLEPATVCIAIANCHLGRREVMGPHLFVARTEPDNLQVDCSSKDQLLLSLEMGGSNWPSSCRNGVCRTCIGQLLSGRVRYSVEWPGLSAEELSAGYVLPCVAHPCTDLVLRQGY